MTVQLRAVTTPVYDSTTPGSIAKPSGTQTGDLLIFHYFHDQASPSQVEIERDWQPVPLSWMGGESGQRLYYRYAAADEPASYAITWGGSVTNGFALAAFYSDAAQNVAIAEIARYRAESEVNRLFPSITISASSSLVAYFGAFGFNGACTPDAACTERYDTGTAGCRMYLMTEARAVSGATGTRTATNATAARVRTVSLALVEAADSPYPGPLFVQDTVLNPSTITTGTMSLAVPAKLAVGDLMLLLVTFGSTDDTPTVPAGWTAVTGGANTGSHSVRTYTKTAVAGDLGSSVTVTFTAASRTAGMVIQAWRSPNGHNLIVSDADNQSNGAGHLLVPAVDSEKTKAGLGAFGCTPSVSGTINPPDIGHLSSSGTSGQHRQASAFAYLHASGSTGTMQFTHTTTPSSSRSAALVIIESDPPTNAPSNLVAAGQSTSQIDLTWTDNSDNETGFEIDHSTDGSSWSLLHTTAANVTSYSHTGLAEYSLHYYRVRAVNDDGETAYSDPDNERTHLAAPSNLAAVAASASQIDLTWDDNSGAEDGYKVERSPNGSTGWTQIGTVGAGVESYSATGLTANTPYWFRVRAYAGSDNSAYSASATATTLLATPASLTATAKLSTKISLAWSDSNPSEDNFEVERSPNGSTGWTQIATPTATSYDDEGLSPATPYYYRVRAKQGANYSAYSASANATTFAALVAPTSVNANALSQTEIELTWSNSNSPVTGFRVERSPNGSTGWTEIATPGAAPYVNSGLTPDTPYYYRVRAYREGSIEYSAYSASATATTLGATEAPKQLHLWLLQPAVVFAARVNLANASYPLDEIPYDGVTAGAYGDVRHGQTVCIGTSAGADDLGRQRIRGDATSTFLRVGRSSQGVNDGELTLTDNAYLTVLDDYRVWSKIPYIEENGTIHKDSELAFSDQTLEPPPVANAGAGVAGTVSASTGLLTVAFDGSASFATADGAAITEYSWDLKDFEGVTAGATDEAQVTATFPPGFRWVNLTVTDTNGKTMTSHRPVYARDPADDGQAGGCIQGFQIESHRITPQGQQLRLRLRRPLATYPAGTLVMLWDSEPASPADRTHMLFVGWQQSEPGSLQAERGGLLTEVSYECVDVAGRLDSLPGFPQVIEADATPASWLEMAAPTMDKYLHYLLYWHSTALEIADWEWTFSDSAYAFKILGSEGESLFDQVNRRCQSMVPDHLLVCNRRGQLAVRPDPLLQDEAERTETVQAELGAADYSELRFERTRPPRLHWLRGSAILASSGNVGAVFCVAPGSAPGQGELARDHGEQLAPSQSALNVTTGHRYARANAQLAPLRLTLARGDDLALEPADLTWVQLTVPASLGAGLALSEARGLVKEMTIRYGHERGGLVRTVELVWEQETSGTPALTVVPEQADPVDDGDTWVPPEPVPPGEPLPSSGVQKIAVISNLGVIFRTTNFQSTPPTWAKDDSITNDFDTSNEIYSFVVDPFSPLYRGLGNTVRGFAATEDGIWLIDDIFAVNGAPTATELYTFDDTGELEWWRSIHASFGRYQEAEADNPWIIVASYYYNSSSEDRKGVYTVASTDGGQTWGALTEVNTEDPDDYDQRVGNNYPLHRVGIWCSPRTPGLAFVGGYSLAPEPGEYGAGGAVWMSSDWGASWDLDYEGRFNTFLVHHRLGGHLHIPWPDNDDEVMSYNGWVRWIEDPPDTWKVFYGLARQANDISPTHEGKSYGPREGLFGVRTHDNDRRYVVMAGFANGSTDFEDKHASTLAAVFISSDYGNTWTLIEGPIATGANVQYPEQAAFSADNPNELFLWGNQGYIGYSVDFGATVIDKSVPEGEEGWFNNEEMVGFVGGEA